MRNAVPPILFFTILLVSVCSCSTQYRIGRAADRFLLKDSVLEHAHVGIAIQDASTERSLYDFQGDHFFVPASNNKLLTCYTALRYLGEQLPGIKYAETEKAIVLSPTADPTFLHPEFSQQPVFDFLKKQTKPLQIQTDHWKTNAFGNGWNWDDYNEDYMPERSPLPVYGNVVQWFRTVDTAVRRDLQNDDAPATTFYSIPEVNFSVRFLNDTTAPHFSVQRAINENKFFITEGKEKLAKQEVPFITNGLSTALELLKDTLSKEIQPIDTAPQKLKYNIIYSQQTDSMLKNLMYRSDNFYAEQLLLMVADQQWNVMDEKKTIAHVLQHELAGLPQKPNWVDGSGLSRYNLISPRDLVYVLHLLKEQEGMERMKTILPTGGQGTLAKYYREDAGYIYAKTGSLGGVAALSGYLYTKKGKLLLFSVLVNNHRGSGTAVRRSVEKFLRSVRDRY